MDRQRDGWMDGWMGGWMDGLMDGLMDGYKGKQINGWVGDFHR